MENLHTQVADLPLAVALQQSVLASAGVGNSGGGVTIAALMPQARAANTWRSTDALWKTWSLFCEVDGVKTLEADEPALLRYLGWLYEENSVGHNSVKNYLSAVNTAQKRIGRTLDYTPLVNLALSAYKNADADLKNLNNPEHSKELRAFQS